MQFQAIDIRDLPKSPVTLINDEWGLLSAGDEAEYNTMTVSWGAVGEIWSKDAVFAFVRPQRYTHEFMERYDHFTLSFLGEGRKDVHRICGAKSGRDIDKAKEAELTPVFLDGSVTFQQAEYVIVCRKMAVQQIDPAGFLLPEIAQNYPAADYHTVYIGEIIQTYTKA